MKTFKQIITAIAFIALLLPTNSFAQGTSHSSKSDYDILMKKIKIKIDVTWGRKSKGCKKFGICDVDFDIEFDLKANKDSNTTTVLLEKSKDNKFLLTIPYSNINKNLKETQFSNQYLIIGEDVFLSDKSLLELGFEKGAYIIKKGEYKMQKTKNSYVVEL